MTETEHAAAAPIVTSPVPGFGLPAGWWPLAHSADVTGRLRAVRLGAQPVAVYRDDNGDIHALLDRCPHRRLPLSMGRITEDGLQCGYHGWTFDRAGQCTLIPNFKPGERPSARIRVDAFPVTEDDGFVFLWTGDGPAPVTSDLVPRADATARPPGGRRRRGTAFVRSPYQLVIDALLANPGSALCLRLLFGSGDEVFGPELVPATIDQAVAVRRERRTLELPRVSTFDPPMGQRSARVLITTVAATGTTEVAADGPGDGAVRAVITVTPEGSHKSVVRWQVRAYGGRARALLAVSRPAFGGRQMAGSVVRALERATDAAPAPDPAVGRLRDLRASG